MLTVRNPRYRDLPVIEGFRYPDYFLKVPCGKCYECNKRRASEWRVRLVKEYELGKHRTVYFVTLTFDQPSHKRFIEANAPEKAIRLFLERYRACTGKSLRHWFVVEYGEDVRHTHRFHFHGLIFDPLVSYQKLKSLWSYGFSYIERLQGARGCSYVVKYITKSQKHYGPYSGRVFTSPGFGKCYLTPESRRLHRSQYDPCKPVDVEHFNNATYIYINNYKYVLPRYYRKHIFSEAERLRITRAWCRFYHDLEYGVLATQKRINQLNLFTNAECFRCKTSAESTFKRFVNDLIPRYARAWGAVPSRVR